MSNPKPVSEDEEEDWNKRKIETVENIAPQMERFSMKYIVYLSDSFF